MSAFLPHSVSPVNNRLRMRRTMQLAPPPCVAHTQDTSSESSIEQIEDRIFAIGDCADAFGAIQSGNSAYWQAEVAAKNVLRLIKRDEGEEAEELQEYNPNPPMIKITLGMVSAFRWRLFEEVGQLIDHFAAADGLREMYGRRGSERQRRQGGPGCQPHVVRLELLHRIDCEWY